MRFLNRIIIISLILTLSGCNINKNTYQLKDHSRQLSQLEINNAEKMFEAISLNRIDDALPIMGTKLKEDLKDSVFFEYLSKLIPDSNFLNKEQIRITNHNLVNLDHLVEVEYQYEYLDGFIHYIVKYNGNVQDGLIEGVSIVYRSKKNL